MLRTEAIARSPAQEAAGKSAVQNGYRENVDGHSDSPETASERGTEVSDFNLASPKMGSAISDSLALLC
jgi:hypothetical protein